MGAKKRALKIPLKLKGTKCSLLYTLAKTEIIYPQNVGALIAMNFT